MPTPHTVCRGCLYALSSTKMGFGFFIWLDRPGGKVYFPLSSLILFFLLLILLFICFFNFTMAVSLGNFPGDVWPKVCNMRNSSPKKLPTAKTMFAYRDYVASWGQGRLGDLIFNDILFNFIWIKREGKKKKNERTKSWEGRRESGGNFYKGRLQLRLIPAIATILHIY